MPKEGVRTVARGKAQIALENILSRMGAHSISALYRDQVRTVRTRSYHLQSPKSPASVEILETLLGIELKIGKRRLLCPDRATARFLAVFATLGVTDVAVPYDITQVARLAAVFETSLADLNRETETECASFSAALRGRVRNLLMARERADIIEAGAGPAIPEFVQNTRQRRVR